MRCREGRAHPTFLTGHAGGPRAPKRHAKLFTEGLHTLAVHTPAGRVAASGVDESMPDSGLLKVWKASALDDGQVLAQRKKDLPAAIAWSPGGERLAVGWGKGDVTVLRAEDKATHRKLGRHEQRVTAIAWSPDGEQLASTGEDRKLRIWNLGADKDAALHTRATDPPAPLQSVAWSPDGSKLYTGQAFLMGDSPGLHVWDASSGEHLRSLKVVPDVVDLRAVTHAGRPLLLAASLKPKHAATLIDPAKDELVKRFPSVDGYGTRIAWAPAGHAIALVTSGQEQTFRLWRR